jgi:arylsulfatase A-like enzyme
MTGAAIAWLDETPEPWFAYVPYACAHAPWHAPPADLVYEPVPGNSPATTKLNAMIESIDVSIGRVLASLPDDVLDRTIVVVAGDNGTPGQVAELPALPSSGKGTMTEGGIRVPLIIAAPGVAPGRSASLASVMDLWPTLFELAGESMPLDRELDGVSLAPVLRGEADSVRELLYIDFASNVPLPAAENRMQAVISQTHKLRVERAAPATLHAVTSGLLEGPDLMSAPLSPADQAARDQLLAEYQRMEQLTQQTWNPSP